MEKKLRSSCLKRLKGVIWQILKLEGYVRKMTKQARKQDTRGKIMMGGLVIKAGLGYLHEEQKDVLLGILVDAREKLAGESQEVYVEHFKALGKQAFE